MFCFTKFDEEMVQAIKGGFCGYKRLAFEPSWWLQWGKEQFFKVFGNIMLGNNIEELILIPDASDTLHVPGLAMLSDYA